MKKLLVSLLILITTIVVAGCGGGGSNDNDSKGGTLKVQGIFTRVDGVQKPLKDALVEVIGTDCKGKSDAEGNVTINSIPFGTYLVKCTFTGKAPVYALMTITTSPNSWNSVGLMTWAENNNELYLTGYVDQTKCNLTGTVKTADGKRLSGATITVSPAADKFYYLGTDNSSFPPKDILVDKATNTDSKTDSSGIFFAVLSKGEYTITTSDGGSHNFDPVKITIPEPCMFNLVIKAK